MSDLFSTSFEIISPLAPLYQAPSFSSAYVTQALKGERVFVLKKHPPFAFVQLEEDAYQGYVALEALAPLLHLPTHWISVPKTFVYPAPSLKTSPLHPLYLGCSLFVPNQATPEEDENFSALQGEGYIFRSHIRPLNVFSSDPLSLARSYCGTPYLWGGKSYDGIDCSGLVQLVLNASGKKCPRDSGMIEAYFKKTSQEEKLFGFSLVFWKGHVGILTEQHTLLHANAYHMQVVEEPFADALKRLKKPIFQKML